MKTLLQKDVVQINMFAIQGENYHLLGSLTPEDGETAKFSQLYIVDTENEIENRAGILR